MAALRSALFRTSRRAIHSTRASLASSSEPAWGTRVNEPGGRLFGEPILKPGERRKLFAWEVPAYVTFVSAVVILGVGLNSRPESELLKDVEKEAQRRVDLLGLDEE